MKQKNLIKNPDNWIKYARAKTSKHGRGVDPLNEEATYFHLGRIWSFNDNFKTTHTQIIQVFNNAIRLAIKQESQEKN